MVFQASAPPAVLRTSLRPINDARPFVSVLVPVRNEAACLGDTLRQLLDQDYDPQRFEILVADGASTDATRDIVMAMQRRHANLRLLGNPRAWSSAGRNVALRAARGDIMLLIDGHCEINNTAYISDLVDAFDRSGAACIGRPQPLDMTGANQIQRAIAAARSSPLGHHPASHIYANTEGFVAPQSVAIAYRRQVFDTIGLFDETFDACEDVEFNHRVAQAGLPCYFTPKVQVNYHPRGTLVGLGCQMFRYGRGRARLLRKHKDSWSPGGFLPALFLLGLLTGPLCGLIWSPLFAMYFGCLALYSAGVVGMSVWLARREWTLLPLLPVVFATIHFGAGGGVLYEMAFGSKRRQSEEILVEQRRLAA